MDTALGVELRTRRSLSALQFDGFVTLLVLTDHMIFYHGQHRGPSQTYLATYFETLSTRSITGITGI